MLIQNSCNIVYPRNMVCFKYITVNTLHKGDNKDDDDDDNSDNDDDDDDGDDNNNQTVLHHLRVSTLL